MIPYKKEQALRVWAAGDYPAVILGVQEKTSKAGNDMLEIKFEAYRGTDTMQLFDYIVFPTFVWKLRRLARALGAADAFEAETFDPADYTGRNLTLTLDVDPPKDGFDERNKIVGYAAMDAPAPNGEPKPYSDLPF